jgi:cytochrome b involved in lipid metabolism
MVWPIGMVVVAGGRDPIHLYCGKDATETFFMIHSRYVIDRLADLPAVGTWAE